MSIYKGSRYEYSTIDFVITKVGGEAKPIVFYTITPLGRLTYREHTFTLGERLDQLAAKYYKNPENWWIIAEFNPDVDFTNIPVGKILRIPNV